MKSFKTIEVEGRYELEGEAPAPNQLINADLWPTPVAKRQWGYYNYIMLWVGIAISVTTWMLGAGMIAAGFTWKATILTITLGQICVLIPLCLNGFAGAKYGIPFPVFLRSSFGIYGAYVPALMRGLLACVWLGIGTYLGAFALDSLAGVLFAGWSSVNGHLWITLAVFYIIQTWISFTPPHKQMTGMRKLADIGSPALLVISIGLLFWAVSKAGGWGPIFSQPDNGDWSKWGLFLSGFIAFWSTMAINISDLTRFSKSQHVQVIGQAVGLPLTMLFFSFIGVAVTSATVVIFGEAIWDPSVVIVKTGSTWFAFVGLIFIALAMLTTNIAANIVPPANDIMNLYPKKITWAGAVAISTIISIVSQPWRLLSDYAAYIFGWLGTYGSVTGPIAGILIADFWICKHQQLNLADLYRRDGVYARFGGFNPIGLISLAGGILLSLVPAFANWRWFVGLFFGLILYVVLYFAWGQKAFAEASPQKADKSG